MITDEQLRAMTALRRYNETCQRDVFPDRFKIARRVLWGALALLAIYEWTTIYGTM